MTPEETLALARAGRTTVLICAKTIIPDKPLVALDQLTLDTRLAASDCKLVAQALFIHPIRTRWYPVTKHWDLPVIIIM